MIGLYFSRHGYERCDEFTRILVEVYNKLKEKEENFEVVLISLNDKDEDFKEALKTMLWLALPFKDEKCKKLLPYFRVCTIPALVIIGQDGKTSNPNAVRLIKERGIDAYPFAPEELDESPNAKLESQTLESPSVSGVRFFVIEKDGPNVKVSCCCNESKNDEVAEEAEEGKEKSDP